MTKSDEITGGTPGKRREYGAQCLIKKSMFLNGGCIAIIPKSDYCHLLTSEHMPRALFVAGGWDGHQPEKIAELFSSELQSLGFETHTETSLEIFSDVDRLKSFDVISPCWTMGTLEKEQSAGLLSAIHQGVALAGIHGGMGDAFRGNLEYEWMVGGHFVGHPHVGDYQVRIKDFASPITKGIPGTFAYHSEQYYMMIDPAVHILADTEYLYEGRSCTMPVAWVRPWGRGRVFYSALGHDPVEFGKFPEAKQLTVQGILWAAGVLES